MQSLASDPQGCDTEPQQRLLACLKPSPGLKLPVREEGLVPTAAQSPEYRALWPPTPALCRVREQGVPQPSTEARRSGTPQPSTETRRGTSQPSTETRRRGTPQPSTETRRRDSPAAYISMAATCCVSILPFVRRAEDFAPPNRRPTLAIFSKMSLTSSPMYSPLIIFSNLR